MSGQWELIWFGLAVAGIGAGVAFLFWTPWYVEDDDDYPVHGSRNTTHRMSLLIGGLLIAVLGLGIAIRHVLKLILP